MQSKTCKTCKQIKPSAEFTKAKTKSGISAQCKPCKSEQQKAYAAANPDRVLASKKAWRDANPEKQRALTAAWVKENADHVRAHARAAYAADPEKAAQIRRAKYEKHAEARREYAREWRRNNAASNAELSRRYDAAKNLAFPAWADPDKIKAFYEVARQKTIETGFAWHVDHILPLKSNVVCGLHNQFNLQVIPANDNLRKGNRVLEFDAVA